MRTADLTIKVKELRELYAMADELDALIETAQDEIKAFMNAAEKETLTGPGWKVTYKRIENKRFDVNTFRADCPEIAAAYMKTSSYKRFTVV